MARRTAYWIENWSSCCYKCANSLWWQGQSGRAIRQVLNCVRGQNMYNRHWLHPTYKSPEGQQPQYQAETYIQGKTIACFPCCYVCRAWTLGSQFPNGYKGRVQCDMWQDRWRDTESPYCLMTCVNYTNGYGTWCTLKLLSWVQSILVISCRKGEVEKEDFRIDYTTSNNRLTDNVNIAASPACHSPLNRFTAHQEKSLAPIS